MLGKPKSVENLDALHDEAYLALKAASEAFLDENCSRRGQFPSVAHGLSFGGGQKVRISMGLASLFHY